MASRTAVHATPVPAGGSSARSLRVRPDQLHLVSGWSLLITDTRGRVQSLYVDNTRLLSRARLLVDGIEPLAFSTADVGAHAQLSYAQLQDGEKQVGRGAYLMTEHELGDGLRTRFTVISTDDRELVIPAELEPAADFVDIDDVEQGAEPPPISSSWDSPRQELRICTESPLPMAVRLRVEGAVAVHQEGVLLFTFVVPPHGSASVSLVVEPELARPRGDANGPQAQLASEATRLRTSNHHVAATWETAVNDLAALPLGEPAGPSAPIAGLPYYQQVFGRDTLTVSWQALLATPTLLRDSLRLNASLVGRRIDDWRDEEPGKLLHQARHGPRSVLGRDPFLGYYGDFATGPDFLVFLGQYLAWTGDLDTVRELLPVARQVLQWLDRYADLDGDGFLDYRCRSSGGVKNQGWKDSDTAVVDEHGRVVDNPVATSELQGYWYAALRHSALAFAACGDRAFAAGLVGSARALRRRFHDAFWMPELGCYAMALGPDGEQVRSIGSNDGHLLAAGIVPRSLAPAVARRLLEPDMFSGWGVRTLSADHPAYNPFSYHRGSVWPVEAGTIGLGLARYGCWDELHRLAEGFFAAAALFEDHRLPEALSGLPRGEEHPHPGTYPRSCSPQAWSASAVMTVVQALLGLRPAAPMRALLVDPHLPDWLPDVELEGVQVAGRTCDLRVRRHGRRTRISARGVSLLRAPLRRPPLPGLP